jgi:hypothetical protein
MNTWKAIAGLVILLVGIALVWNSYNQLARCNSTGGKILTAISNFFGNNGIQSCNNAGVLEVVGIVAAAAGLVVLLLAANGK